MQLIVEPVWPWPAVLMIGIGLLAVVLVTYPPRVRHLSAVRRRVLVGLRLLTALLLVFSMLRPAVRFTETDTQSAELVILTDRSASMATPDGPGGITRREALLQALSEAEGPLGQLAEKIDVRYVDFAEQPTVVEQPEDVADGDFTAIGASLDELRQEDTGRRLYGVVLMSDGTQRAVAPFDSDPRTAARRIAEQLGVPIHTVPFGTSDLSTAGLDLAVEDVISDSVTFEKKTVPFRAQLRLRGAAGRTVQLRLLKEDRTGKRSGESGELKPVPFVSGSNPSTEITAKDNDEELTVELSLVAEQPGEYKVAVEVVPLEGELKLTNNRLETLLTVRKGGLKVAYFDVLGRNESKFVEKLDRTAKIQFDQQVLLPGALASRTEISPQWFEPGKYDVFIIGDVPASVFRQGQGDLLKLLADRLRDGAGLLMLGGEHNYGAGGYADTPLADYLPVVMSPAERRPDGTVDPAQQYDRRLPMVPTRAGVALHYIMNLDPRDNAGMWARLPPLEGANRLTPKESATVLAESTDHIPLLIATDTGRSRVIASAVDSTWLWHMHGFQDAHQRFWQQMILWLARKEQEGDQPVWVQADPRNYAPQTDVTLTFGARGEDRQPLTDVEFEVSLTKPDGEVKELTPQRRGENRFAVFKETGQPGDYWVTVTARRNGVAWQLPATTRFIVDPRDLERDNPAADLNLMEEIAALTGTAPIPAEQFGSFIESLLEAGLTTELTQHTQVNLWDNWPLLLLFVLMMSTEWFVRKRRGLV